MGLGIVVNGILRIPACWFDPLGIVHIVLVFITAIWVNLVTFHDRDLGVNCETYNISRGNTIFLEWEY